MLLNCHTCHSYKYGTIPIEELLSTLKENGYQNAVLTDINSTSATMDFVRLSSRYKVRPIVGIDFRNGAQQQYIGIARNNEGYLELNQHLSEHLHENEPFEDQAPRFNHAYVIYPMHFSPSDRELYDNEFIGVKYSDLTKLQFTRWRNSNKLVVLHTVSVRNKKEYNAHRLLRAIDNNTLLSQLEVSQQAGINDAIIPYDILYDHYVDHPKIIANTKFIIDDCSIHFDFQTQKNKKVFTGSAARDSELLEQLCQEGLRFRYANPKKTIIDRMNKELYLIRKLGFSAYFLINWDLVKFARSKNYYYVGRGSGANSIVAYLLRITDVDPIELDLYFERFINPSRTSPPDFDIDFSSRDRDAVTKYIFETHGYQKTALVGSYITFQYKSVIRELGKVFGLPTDEIAKVQKESDYRQLDDIGKLIVKYSHYIHELPSHMSVHSSGVIISDQLMHNYTATWMPPKGFPTAHFSMLEAEDVGLSKFDILGQRGLGKIKDAVEIIKINQKVQVDIHNIERIKKDKKVKQLIKTGNAVGCFYVESPAMRNLLKKLEADDYVRLVAASSIIRPGVSQSGMMQEYIRRYKYPELREQARKKLPELYSILEDTYGIMVYQEDVIKVAHLFAGLTLEQADVLRRGMSGKYRSREEFFAVKQSFFDNCKKRNYSDKVTKDIWRQIESFAGYAFPKGHSASYAVESFQALYLKAYYPIEYMVATINNGGGFFSKSLYLHEAKLHGALVSPPCVNQSEYYSVIKNNNIWLGFHIVHALESESIKRIIENRISGGVFLSLRDFVKRVLISLDQLRLLIRVGAFEFCEEPKVTLLWQAHLLLGNNKKTTPKPTLFQSTTKHYDIPSLEQSRLEKAYDQMELLGFSLNIPQFEMIADTPRTDLIVADLHKYVNQKVQIIGQLIHRKRTKTSGGKEMSFGTFLDQVGMWLDTVQFPEVNAQYPFQGYGCYLICGKVVDDMGVLMIETKWVKRLEPINLEEDNPKRTTGIEV